MLSDWPTRAHAERTRQWPIIAHVGEQIAKMPEFDGLLILGSFASGATDDLSDVDLICVVADGRFAAAWKRRAELETPGALFVWDLVVDPSVDEGGHMWITRDLVKVDLGIVDPARGDTQLAPPYAVVVGDPSIARRFPPVEAIPLEMVEAYAQKLRDGGLVPEVESRYGDLKAAIRRARNG